MLFGQEVAPLAESFQADQAELELDVKLLATQLGNTSLHYHGTAWGVNLIVQKLPNGLQEKRLSLDSSYNQQYIHITYMYFTVGGRLYGGEWSSCNYKVAGSIPALPMLKCP